VYQLFINIFVGRAILPAAGFQPALVAQKGGCGQIGLPTKAN
jgi:hypothetical protein